MPVAAPSPRPSLTPRQLDVFEFVCSYWREHGYAPTMQEVAVAFKVSKVTVWERVRELVRKRYVEQAEKYRSRSLRPIIGPCPCCGQRIETVPADAAV